MDKIKVKYASGKTINLGNYESARVDIGVEFMCDNNKAAVEEMYVKMKKFVDDKVTEGVAEWQA